MDKRSPTQDRMTYHNIVLRHGASESVGSNVTNATLSRVEGSGRLSLLIPAYRHHFDSSNRDFASIPSRIISSSSTTFRTASSSTKSKALRRSVRDSKCDVSRAASLNGFNENTRWYGRYRASNEDLEAENPAEHHQQEFARHGQLRIQLMSQYRQDRA